MHDLKYRIEVWNKNSIMCPRTGIDPWIHRTLSGRSTIKPHPSLIKCPKTYRINVHTKIFLLDNNYDIYIYTFLITFLINSVCYYPPTPNCLCYNTQTHSENMFMEHPCTMHYRELAWSRSLMYISNERSPKHKSQLGYARSTHIHAARPCKYTKT